METDRYSTTTPREESTRPPSSSKEIIFLSDRLRISICSCKHSPSPSPSPSPNSKSYFPCKTTFELDGPDQRREMWNGLKQRLGLKRMGCCAATWSPDASPMATRESTAEDDRDHERTMVTIGQVLGCDGARQLQGMNLAAALEAERNSRGGGAGAGGVTTLMRLIEETDGVDLMVRRRRERRRKAATAEGGGGTGGGCDWLCCLCMERDKGAAFIPCGHAFCRECSRELWLGRGRCPICNRSIVEILDLF